MGCQFRKWECGCFDYFCIVGEIHGKVLQNSTVSVFGMYYIYGILENVRFESKHIEDISSCFLYPTSSCAFILIVTTYTSISSPNLVLKYIYTSHLLFPN